MAKKKEIKKTKKKVEKAAIVLVENVQDITTPKMESLMKLEQERRGLMTEYINDNFKAGVDFVTISFGKTTSKPSLSKAGSEKWLSLFHFRAVFKKDTDTREMAGNPDGLFCYVCELLNARGDVIGEGRGAANIAEKQNWLANNAIKIAQKRAQIDAVLRTGSLSDFFTQDLEDMNGGKIVKAPVKQVEKAKTTSGKLTGSATEKQVKFIYSLLKKFGANTREEALKMISGKMEKLYTELKFTAQEASDIITKLKEELDGRNQDRLLNDVEEKKEPNLQVIDGDRIPDTILSSEIPQ